MLDDVTLEIQTRLLQTDVGLFGKLPQSVVLRFGDNAQPLAQHGYRTAELSRRRTIQVGQTKAFLARFRDR